MRFKIVRGVWLLAALIASGCSETTTQCTQDADCAPGARCDVATNQCLCVTSEACEEGFRCNSAGVCQLQEGCVTNADCDDGTFCDAGSGRCLNGPALALRAACGLATHCPAGSVCEAGVCEAGCIDTGDCPLGEVCIDGDQGRFCSDGFAICEDNSYCSFGANCVDNQCEDDLRGPYCQGCSPRTQGNPLPCGDGRNFCLVNNRELGGFTNNCGVDCSTTSQRPGACPNGYTCNNVVVLTRDQCQTTAQCQCQNILPRERSCTLSEVCRPLLPDGRPDPNATGCFVEDFVGCNPGDSTGSACVVRVGEQQGTCTCASDAQCPDGAVCIGGDCCTGAIEDGRQCVSGEGQLSGFCTCETDDDCQGADVCDSSTGTCSVTGFPCTPGLDDCPVIPCVDGGCLIGANCAPEQGRTCSQLTGR